MRHRVRRIVRQIGVLAAITLAGGLLAAALVRNGPGFDADERQLDPRLGMESQSILRAEHAANHDVLRFYERYLGRMLRGDFGMSQSLDRPISELIASRLLVTLRIMAEGVLGGWALAAALALPVVMWRRRMYTAAAEVISTCALCVPSAAAAAAVFIAGGPVHAIVALVLFPRLFEYLRNLLANGYAQSHIVTARAKGLHPLRILLRHVLPVCRPELLALAGISMTMAFGASIPVEALCDLPGIGQLAWKAAMARDLPLLVTLTMLIAIFTQLCNAVSDWASGFGRCDA